jgi:hypothetical protein
MLLKLAGLMMLAGQPRGGRSAAVAGTFDGVIRK